MKNFNIEEIENKIGYTFKNKKLLAQAFTHTSFSNENNEDSYERLEFLGDATIGFIIAEQLFNRYPKIDEGKLTKARALLVSRNTMSDIVEETGLIEFMRVGEGDIKNNVDKSSSVKCDLFESITGAILVDNNFKMADCKTFILKFFENRLSSIKNDNNFMDYKSLALEECAKNNQKAEFIIDEEKTQNNQFKAKFLIDGKQVSEAIANTKKEAQKKAAQEYLSIN